MAGDDSKFCNCLYYAANALGRVMTKMAEEEFAMTGLAPSYAFLVMSVVEKPGIQPKELSEQMQLTPSTVTRLLEKVELKGFVERRSVGRRTEVYPTEKSRELDPKIRKAWQSLYTRYSRVLGDGANALTRAVYDAAKKLGR
jgi:DNA-binding MarR family transcriptional regulator